MSSRRLATVGLCGAFLFAAGCTTIPSQSGLESKLQQVNGITEAQSRCIAEGMYDQLSDEELRVVAKPDNAGKAEPATIQLIRDLVQECVPAEPATGLAPQGAG